LRSQFSASELAVGNHDLEWVAIYDSPQSNVLDLSLAPEIHEFQDESLFGDSFQYLQAERLGPRTAFPISDYEVIRHSQLGSRGEYTAYFLNQFGRKPIPNHSLSHPKASSSNLLDQVEAWMGEICPGAKLNFTALVDVDLVSLHTFTDIAVGFVKGCTRTWKMARKFGRSALSSSRDWSSANP
jgi:hypothetical protein